MSGMQLLMKSMGINPDEMMKAVQEFAKTAQEGKADLELIKAKQIEMDEKLDKLLAAKVGP